VFNEPISYLPGQFLSVVRKMGELEIRRQYSFSSHPVLSPNPTITIKRIDNGELSRWFFDEAKVGDELQSTGVSGRFTLPNDVDKIDTFLFLAAGSGITPIFSLLQEILNFHPAKRVILVYSNRSEQDAIFLTRLKQWEKKFHQLTIDYFYSTNKNLMRARLGNLVLMDLYKKHITDPSKTIAYLCGPYDYMQMLEITLRTEGLAAERVRKEVFVSPEVSEELLPPDEPPHQVTIKFQGKTFSFRVQYPTTILQAAKSESLDLPFSCEAGRCGTCAATCTKGEVWMRVNEVLSDKEVSNGRVLTCTGYPVGGEVELRFES
jgi:ferredoxin-NADP reductase